MEVESYAELLKKASTNCDESLASRRASRVWIRLAEMFGARFMREFGTRPNDLWVAQIAKMNDQQIRLSLEGLLESGRSHPPTLAEFVDAGRPSKPETGSPRYLGANPIHMTQLRISGQLPQPPKVARDISALRMALKGKTV